MVHCPHESFVDHFAVYTTPIFGHAAADLHPPPLTQWRLSAGEVEWCQRWALIRGICRRVEAVSGGWWELGEEVYMLWKLLATWPQLVSAALPLSTQTIRILHRDGWVLLMLAALHSARTNMQWCHNDHILKNLWECTPAHTHGKNETVRWKEKPQVRESWGPLGFGGAISGLNHAGKALWVSNSRADCDGGRGRQEEGQLLTHNERHDKAFTASLNAGRGLPLRVQIPQGSKNESLAHNSIFYIRMVD